MIMPGLLSIEFEIPYSCHRDLIGTCDGKNEWILIGDIVIELQIFVLTSSTVGSGWTVEEEGSHCHTVCQGEVNRMKGHL